MDTVSIGCLQPQGWLVLFRVFRLGGQALCAAQASSGCVDAQIFRKGKWYFAFSVWESPVHMQIYATTGVHGRMMRRAGVPQGLYLDGL